MRIRRRPFVEDLSLELTAATNALTQIPMNTTATNISTNVVPEVQALAFLTVIVIGS